MSNTVDTLVAQLAVPKPTGTELVFGVVTAVAGAELTVSIAGTDVDELRYLVGWTPSVGDTVLVATLGGTGDLVVLGKLS